MKFSETHKENTQNNKKSSGKEVLNINLSEEKKTIERNILEWIKQKYNVNNTETETDNNSKEELI